MSYRILILLLIFLTSISWLAFLVSIAPSTSNELKFPSSFEDLQMISDLLSSYLDRAFTYVLVLFSSAYLFKQTFAVPGSVFMNVLGGAVFGLQSGFLLCSILTAIGATLCYALARFCGQKLAMEKFPKQIDSFKTQLESNQNSLIFFLLFLRLFPMSPNWAINMSCGVLNVPIEKFFISVFVGLMPYNYICVQTGVLLSTISNLDEMFTIQTLLQLTGAALVALVPGLVFKNRQKISTSS